jgi:hypothetical protein
MRSRPIELLLQMAFVLLACLPASVPAQVKIIFGTDMDTDCDAADSLRETLDQLMVQPP